MTEVTEAQTHPTVENEALSGVPLDGLPQQAISVMAWQAEAMPELFGQVFPEAAQGQLRDRVLGHLLAGILSGSDKLRPGSLASENQVANLLSKRLNQKISRTPVREALAILVRDGFVRQFPQKGFEVVEVSADETREVLSLCGEVEALVIERLIATEPSPNLAPLRVVQHTLAKATQQNNRHSWMLGDTAFHAGLALLAGLKDAARSIGRWRQKVHLYSLTHFQPDEMIEVATQDHDALLEAITDRQADQAVELLDQHLEHTMVCLGLSVANLAMAETARRRAQALSA